MQSWPGYYRYVTIGATLVDYKHENFTQQNKLMINCKCTQITLLLLTVFVNYILQLAALDCTMWKGKHTEVDMEELGKC